MNKYQEALERLGAEKLARGQLVRNDDKVEYWFNLLKELVDKENPMKPINHNVNQYKCPKCLKYIKGKKMLYNNVTRKFDVRSSIKVEKIYCPYCGQKIDWSEE